MLSRITDPIRKAMIRRYYKLERLNEYWYNVFLNEDDVLTEKHWNAYRWHRKALDRMIGWRNLMAKFGWGSLTWNNYYGRPVTGREAQLIKDIGRSIPINVGNKK